MQETELWATGPGALELLFGISDAEHMALWAAKALFFMVSFLLSTVTTASPPQAALSSIERKYCLFSFAASSCSTCFRTSQRPHQDSQYAVGPPPAKGPAQVWQHPRPSSGTHKHCCRFEGNCGADTGPSKHSLCNNDTQICWRCYRLG